MRIARVLAAVAVSAIGVSLAQAQDKVNFAVYKYSAKGTRWDATTGAGGLRTTMFGWHVAPIVVNADGVVPAGVSSASAVAWISASGKGKSKQADALGMGASTLFLGVPDAKGKVMSHLANYYNVSHDSPAWEPSGNGMAFDLFGSGKPTAAFAKDGYAPIAGKMCGPFTTSSSSSQMSLWMTDSYDKRSAYAVNQRGDGKPYPNSFASLNEAIGKLSTANGIPIEIPKTLRVFGSYVAGVIVGQGTVFATAGVAKVGADGDGGAFMTMDYSRGVLNGEANYTVGNQGALNFLVDKSATLPFTDLDGTVSEDGNVCVLGGNPAGDQGACTLVTAVKVSAGMTDASLSGKFHSCLIFFTPENEFSVGWIDDNFNGAGGGTRTYHSPDGSSATESLVYAMSHHGVFSLALAEAPDTPFAEGTLNPMMNLFSEADIIPDDQNAVTSFNVGLKEGSGMTVANFVGDYDLITYSRAVGTKKSSVNRHSVTVAGDGTGTASASGGDPVDLTYTVTATGTLQITISTGHVIGETIMEGYLAQDGDYLVIRDFNPSDGYLGVGVGVRKR